MYVLYKQVSMIASAIFLIYKIILWSIKYQKKLKTDLLQIACFI